MNTNSPAQTSSTPNELRPKMAGLLLILAVTLVYGRFFYNPPVFDDLNVLTNEQLLQGYGHSFFTFSLRWFPYASFGWVHNLAGMNFVWHRLINLLLHAATVLALYRFLALLFRTVLKEQGADRLAFWGAMIFAMHPAAVYAAGYLIERSIVMATLFSILALYAFLKGLTGGKRRWLYFSTLFYFLAVFSKEHAVMLPAAIAAMTLLVRRPSIALLREMAAPIALFFAIALLIVLKAKGVLGQPYEPFAAGMLAAVAENHAGFNIEHAYPLSILMEGMLFFKYLGLWLLPYVGWMSIDLRAEFPSGFFSWPYTLGFLAFVAYPFFALKLLLRGGKTGLAGFALLFPWLMFLTELTTIRIQEPIVLYRSYLWMLTLPALLPVVAGRFAPRRENIVLAIVVLVLAISAWNRLETFSNDLLLWNDAVTKYPNDQVPGAERGYVNRGVACIRYRLYNIAFADFDRAIAINPKASVAYSDRSMANLNLSRFQEALDDASKAIELNPEYASAYSNRGIAKSRLGQHREALADHDQAIILDPDNSQMRTNRGVARMAAGDAAGALKDFERAVALNPYNHNAAFNRDLVRKKMGAGEAPIKKTP